MLTLKETGYIALNPNVEILDIARILGYQTDQSQSSLELDWSGSRYIALNPDVEILDIARILGYQTDQSQSSLELDCERTGNMEKLKINYLEVPWVSEINFLNKLSHPNIVQYYGSEPGEKALSVYLEYVSGGSIHKLLPEYGPFNDPVIQSYTRHIVSGLAYLHGRNTVHKDVKGVNILVDPNVCTAGWLRVGYDTAIPSSQNKSKLKNSIMPTF
ncbi:hypothetical protein RIF29_11832 [Crotalaria pallida]|uniref:Protein kinase domain-containing protein n=1 Tax=Crotalaria pallida TaxID=3830 RepID=A0AAN9P0D0_CROPI